MVGCLAPAKSAGWLPCSLDCLGFWFVSFGAWQSYSFFSLPFEENYASPWAPTSVTFFSFNFEEKKKREREI